MTTRDRAAHPVDFVIEAIRSDGGNEAAWEQFYAYFRRQVAAALFYGGVLNQSDLEDIVQETFARFISYSPWRHGWQNLPDRRRILAYLRTTAKTVAFNRRAADRSKFEISASDVLDLISTGGGDPDLDRLLASVVDALSDVDRQLLRLVTSDVTLEQIAQHFGISYAAAGTRVHRLKDRIRMILSDGPL